MKFEKARYIKPGQVLLARGNRKITVRSIAIIALNQPFWVWIIDTEDFNHTHCDIIKILS
jgi:hypothetical protein